MHSQFSRRNLLQWAPLHALSTAALAEPTAPSLPDTFPTQAPSLVREMVTVAHGDFNRVRELVSQQPTLAKAAWDWGFGDWESALGAASHTGHRDIAEYLIANGARPTLFSSAMLGHLEVVRAFVAAQPGVQKIAGPHSISLLAHAKAGGTPAQAVFQYLESLRDAGAAPAAAITEEELNALAGTYVFGERPNERIEIAVTGAKITFTREGTSGRGLIHVGDRDFYPAGAASVRIRFAGPILTVHDPGLILTARRT